MTPERLAANRANAQHSTGPKTEAGKEMSRRNAIKHGLTGEGTALPDEDAAEVEAAFQQHYVEMKPKTRAGAVIVHQVAWATLKLARFRIASTATLSDRINNAGYAFDDAQVAKRDEAKAKLFKDPEAQLAVLSRFKVGVEWGLAAWDALSCALLSGKPRNWRQAQFDLFEALTGRSPEFPSYHNSTFWNLAAMGDEGALDDPELPGNSPAAKMQSARDRLLAICEAEQARWETLLEPATAASAIARDNAIKAARYDGSKEGLLAQRYEAATNRELKKALNDFKVVEAEFAEPMPVVETPEGEEACVEVASFCRGPESSDPMDESNVIRGEASIAAISQFPQTAISDRVEGPSASAPGLVSDASCRL